MAQTTLRSQELADLYQFWYRAEKTSIDAYRKWEKTVRDADAAWDSYNTAYQLWENEKMHRRVRH